MARLPRLALGAVDAATDAAPLVWALLDLLGRSGRQTQVYFSQARHVPRDNTRWLTGRGLRFLDSWVMSPEVCRELFCHGAQGVDLALVQGQFGPVTQGGSLDQLCDWLKLPRVAVWNVRALAPHQLPPKPEAHGLLLDGCRQAAEWITWQKQLESTWCLPVLGGLVRDAALDAELSRLDPVAPPSTAVCQALGAALRPSLRLAELLELADGQECGGPLRQLFRAPRHTGPRRRVAVAFDDCFHCYFPTTLELLELAGAEVVDFSPLHDETLPHGTELVLIGCGQPQRPAWAEKLASNHTLKAALSSFVCGGGHVWAEGGAAAWLGESLIDDRGQAWPMTGLLPISARWKAPSVPAAPVELCLARGCWLFPAGARPRGYSHAGWQFATREAECQLACPAPGHLWSRGRVVASDLHLHLPAQTGSMARLWAAAGLAPVATA